MYTNMLSSINLIATNNACIPQRNKFFFFNSYTDETTVGGGSKVPLLAIDMNCYSTSSISNKIQVFNLSLKKNLLHLNEFNNIFESGYYNFKFNYSNIYKNLIKTPIQLCSFNSTANSSILPSGLKFLSLNYNNISFFAKFSPCTFQAKFIKSSVTKLILKDTNDLNMFTHLKKNISTFVSYAASFNIYSLDGSFFTPNNISTSSFYHLTIKPTLNED
jgi:hypothetical protein